jgi:hypothetical protein
MEYYFSQILIGFKEIGRAFTSDFSIWWILAPIFILWFAMEIYFSEYRRERIGFSSALANSFSLLWISLVSLRIFFLLSDPISSVVVNENFWLIVLFIFYALFVIYVSFTHSLSASAVDILASPSRIYYISVISVLLGEGALDINGFIVFDLFLSFMVIYLFFAFMRRFLGVRGEVEAILNKN